MTGDQKIAALLEFSQELLLADGFNDAIIGTCERAGGMGPVALYDTNKCLKILMERDGMDEEEAIEFFEFNVVAAWVGDETPVFATLLTDEEDLCQTGVQTS
jgi:hypothetical protein